MNDPVSEQYERFPYPPVPWPALEARLGPGLRLHYHGHPIPGADLAAQAEWLQSRYGTREPLLGPVKLA